jgi:carboxylesterase
MPGAEPFLYKADGDTACLLVHGFTGSTHEVRALGRHLADSGFTAQGILLTGHGTTPVEMARSSYREWVRDVDFALDELLAAGKRVFLCGMSMGGTLALNVAARRPDDAGLAGIIAMATPLRLVHWRLRLLPIVGLFRRWHAWGQPDIKDESRWAGHVAYGGFHVRAAAQLMALLKETRRLAPRVRQPLLVIHSRHDNTVPVFNAELIMRSVSSQDRRLVWLDNCYHVVTVDYDSERVQKEVEDFIRQH